MTCLLPASAGFASCARRNGHPGYRRWLGMTAIACLVGGTSCASPGGWMDTGATAVWDQHRSDRAGLQIRFYTPSDGAHAMADSTLNSGPRLIGPLPNVGSTHAHGRRMDGILNGDFTTYTLGSDRYEFEYDMAWRNQRLSGEILVRTPTSDPAAAFLRHTSLAINPGGDLRSVLSEEDLARATAGDVVTKVVFVASLGAVDDRVAMIDREIRRLEDLEGRLATQEDYWDAKRAERRRNAFFASDQGWGQDIPSNHMAFYQLLVGPERYHWERYSSADDHVRRYSEELAMLDRPLELLREERSALRSILGGVNVLNRNGDMIVATPSMTQRFRNPVDEIRRARRTLGGFGRTNPLRAIEFPYLFSGGGILSPSLASVETRSGMAESYRSMGEIVAVVRIGPRSSASLD